MEDLQEGPSGSSFKSRFFRGRSGFPPLGDFWPASPEGPSPPTNPSALLWLSPAWKRHCRQPTIYLCTVLQWRSQKVVNHWSHPRREGFGPHCFMTRRNMNFSLGKGTHISLGPKGMPCTNTGGHLSGLSDWSTQGACECKANGLDISWLWSKSSQTVSCLKEATFPPGVAISNYSSRKKE